MLINAYISNYLEYGVKNIWPAEFRAVSLARIGMLYLLLSPHCKTRTIFYVGVCVQFLCTEKSCSQHHSTVYSTK